MEARMNTGLRLRLRSWRTCRTAPSFAPRPAAARPATGVGTRSHFPIRSNFRFLRPIGNAAVIFDFPYNKDNHMPELPNARSVGIAPYDQAWSIGVQRELPWDMFMTVSYVGNRGHSPARRPWNFPISPIRPCCSMDPCWAITFSILPWLPPDSRLPYPEYVDNSEALPPSNRR